MNQLTIEPVNQRNTNAPGTSIAPPPELRPLPSDNAPRFTRPLTHGANTPTQWTQTASDHDQDLPVSSRSRPVILYRVRKLFSKLIARADLHRGHEPTAHFNDVMYLGEGLLKLITLALVSAVEEDRDHHQYRLLYNLVRTQSLQTWISTLEQTTTGAPATKLNQSLKPDLTVLSAPPTQPDDWRLAVVERLDQCATSIGPEPNGNRAPATLIGCLDRFVHVRNKARAHGALPPAVLGSIATLTEESLTSILEHTPLLNRPWAHARRNLSGKFNVTLLGPSTDKFDALKTERTTQYSNGIYTYLDRPIRIRLLESEPDASDVYFPNGSYTSRNEYEAISYTSGKVLKCVNTDLLQPLSQPPPSHTEGTADLGDDLSNLPPQAQGYIT